MRKDASFHVVPFLFSLSITSLFRVHFVYFFERENKRKKSHRYKEQRVTDGSGEKKGRIVGHAVFDRKCN